MKAYTARPCRELACYVFTNARAMQALSQRMKNITPTISEYPAILVLADNNIQLNEMLAIKSRIRATLAKELRNGQIEVEIRLAKHEEIKPMLTPRESLSKLLETNHPVKKLIDTLGFVLGLSNSTSVLLRLILLIIILQINKKLVFF